MSLLSIDEATFKAGFNREPFFVRHELAGHPLFELASLAALSTRLPAPMVEWNAGHAGAYGKPDAIKPSRRPCAETILGVATEPAWVLLRNVQEDPQYARLLDELLDEIEPYSEPLLPGMCQRQGFLFISSEAAVTPYHFDPEYNFLMQVRGHKTVHMWNPANRSVLTAVAIDDHYAFDRDNRDQPYRDNFLESAWILPLGPGQGLHFPLHAPHWVRTESEVSVSFSITFRTRESKFREAVHAANGELRRAFGFEPPAPGKSALWDAFAHVGFRTTRKARSLLGLARPH
jgi:hypothetical protein